MDTLGIITVALSLVVTGLGLTTQVRKNHTRKSMEGLSLFYSRTYANGCSSRRPNKIERVV